jgi:hypothetical protein
MEMKGQRSDCSVEMNHRSESGGKGMNASEPIKTEIKTEPMDEGSATSENSATVKGEFSGSSSQLRLCKSKEGGGVRLKHNCLWFCILLPIVTTCFGLARPSSGRNVVHKGENTHSCLYMGVM